MVVKLTLAFSSIRFFVVRFVANDTSYSNGEIATCLLGIRWYNLALCTNTESQNAQRHRKTDRRTTGLRQ